MSWTTKFSDAMSGTRALHGSTLDNGAGGSGAYTWVEQLTIDANSFNVASGVCTAGGNRCQPRVSGTGSDLTDCAAQITIGASSESCGPVLRGGGADIIGFGSGYMSFARPSFPDLTLYDLDSVSALASNSTAFNAGDVHRIEAVSTGITILKNGSSVLTYTGSEHSHGFSGMYAPAGVSVVVTQFVAEVPSGGGTVVPALDGEMLVGGMLQMSGGL